MKLQETVKQVIAQGDQTDFIHEPLSKGLDPFSKTSAGLLDNLDGQLVNLKKHYLELLDRLIIQPEDILHDAPGFYSAEALNTLYAIEYKIIALQQQLAQSDTDWCREERAKKLFAFKQHKNEAVANFLSGLKAKYSRLLKTSLIIPKKWFIKRSGYYDDQSNEALSRIEEDIKSAYYNKGMTYDKWCEMEKDKYLSKYAVASHRVLTQAITKIGIPVALVIGTGGMSASYVNSVEAIEKFEKTIQLGQQKVSEGQYGEALQLFQEAKNEYEGSFRKGHYREMADEHINVNMEKAVKECAALIQQKKLLSANNLLNSLPQNIVEKNIANADKLKGSKVLLEKAMEEGIDVLILNISANKGHLDASSKEYLNELLAISPHDYWLNFIKNKEK